MEKLNEDYFNEKIMRNISYYAVKFQKEKDMSKLGIAIQYDISNEDKDYK
jgi:hypothetical protein